MYANASTGSGVLHVRKTGAMTSQDKVQRRPVATARRKVVIAQLLPETNKTRLI